MKDFEKNMFVSDKILNDIQNDNKYLTVTETETARDTGLTFRLEKEDILFDIKACMSYYYVATFTADGKSLKISFNNGQTFILKVEEE